MAQHTNYTGLLTSLPTVEEILDDHAPELGHDFIAYRNHVYRVVNPSRSWGTGASSSRR